MKKFKHKGKLLLTHARQMSGPNSEKHREQVLKMMEGGRKIVAENRSVVKAQKEGKPGVFNPSKYRCWMTGNGQQA